MPKLSLKQVDNIRHELAHIQEALKKEGFNDLALRVRSLNIQILDIIRDEEFYDPTHDLG